MFDFPIQEPTVLTSLYCIFSYFFIVRYGYAKFVHNKGMIVSSSLPGASTFFIYVLVSTHAINGDFFHLMDIVHNYVFINGAYASQENFYPILAKMVSKNYLLFRLVLWGIGFFCALSIFKRYGLNKYLALWILLSSYLIS